MQINFETQKSIFIQTNNTFETNSKKIKKKSLFAHFFLLRVIFSLKLKFSKHENKIFEYQKMKKKSHLNAFRIKISLCIY